MARLTRFLFRALVGLWAIALVPVVVCRAVNPFFNDLWYLALVPLLLGAVRFRADRRLTWFALGVAAVWALTGIHPMGPVKTKTMVMGVDGATFEVIDAKSHLLPNFIKLRADGTRAVLISMEPMFSPLLWTTIASGRPPDESGIKGFRVHSNDCQVARFWDIAEESGQSVGLYKWLVDYPPRAFKHGGFWVPSWLAPDVQTWPEELSVVKELELSKRLRRKQKEATHGTVELSWLLVRAGMRFSTLLDAAEWSWEERAMQPSAVGANVRMQTLRGWIDRDVFIRQLYKTQPELATFNYYATDGLAHLYWDRYVKGGPEVLAAYEQADHILGDIRAALGPDTVFFLVSDHGFKPMDEKGQAGQFAPLTERLRDRIVAAVGEVDVAKVGHKLTVGFKDTDQLERGRAFVTTLLDKSGQPFYKLDIVPDMSTGLALTLADESITKERLTTDTVGGEPIAQYVALTDQYTGTHKENGVFYVAGPGVEPYKELPPVNLIDVAPTVLAAMGLPSSIEMRGRTLIFKAQPQVDDWDGLVKNLNWIGLDSESAGDVNTDALKALGYIDDGKSTGPGAAPGAPAAPPLVAPDPTTPPAP
jgi:hypothetical protein